MATGSDVVIAQPVLSTTQVVEADPLVAWLVLQFQNTVDGHRVHELCLTHLDVADRQMPITRMPIKAHTDEIARHSIATVRTLAQQDAQVRGRLERYALVCRWPVDENETYFPFQVNGERSRDLALGSSEPASLEGIAKSQMRHNEILMKLLTKYGLDQMELAERREDRMQKRIDQLESGRLKTLEMAETLLSAHAEREAERIRAANAEARMAAIFREFMDLTPIAKAKAVQWATGHKMIDAKSAEVLALRQLLQSMNMDEFSVLLAALPETSRAKMIELYNGVMKGVPASQQRINDTTAPGTAAPGGEAAAAAATESSAGGGNTSGGTEGEGQPH